LVEASVLNYRHAYHAGNFADLVKHAAVGLILDRMLSDAAPVLAVDTHAGAGLYDLSGAMARKSGEADAGIVRLMADPAAPQGFDTLKALVRRLNPSGPPVIYPGSPVLIADRLRPGDAYIGAELQADDFKALTGALAPVGERARAVQGDGYALAELWARQDPRRMFVLLDPPFERADDYQNAADLVAVLLRRKRPPVIAIWTPLKDLETFDAFVRRLESLPTGGILVAEARLKPLDNPMRLNGCGLIFINEPAGLQQALEPVLNWAVVRLGEADAQSRLWRPAH
jgi:23S rRNA (adenine2030-N6)-methyltransferase